MTTRRTAAGLSCAALTLALAACGSSDSGGSSSSGPVHKIGEGVPFSIPDLSGSGTAKTHEVTYTVDSVTKGTIEDLKDFRLDAADKAKTPYYLKLSVKNGPTAIPKYFFGSPLGAELDNGQRAQSVSLIGAFAKCAPAKVPNDTLAPHAALSGCWVYLVPKDRTLGSLVGYSGTTKVTWSLG